MMKNNEQYSSVRIWGMDLYFYLLTFAFGHRMFAKKSRKEDTLNDFYLAGNSLGLGILFLTLFATQYSGNTFFGFTGATYRVGYSWILSIHFMTSIVVCYLLFAPKLHRLSKKQNFLTPADYIQYRFKYNKLSLIITIIGITRLINHSILKQNKSKFEFIIPKPYFPQGFIPIK